jgi:hypothetical protein
MQKNRGAERNVYSQIIYEEKPFMLQKREESVNETW